MSFHRYQPSTQQTSSVALCRRPWCLVIGLGMLGNLRGFVGFLTSDQEGAS